MAGDLTTLPDTGYGDYCKFSIVHWIDEPVHRSDEGPILSYLSYIAIATSISIDSASLSSLLTSPQLLRLPLSRLGSDTVPPPHHRRRRLRGTAHPHLGPGTVRRSLDLDIPHLHSEALDKIAEASSHTLAEQAFEFAFFTASVRSMFMTVTIGNQCIAWEFRRSIALAERGYDRRTAPTHGSGTPRLFVFCAKRFCMAE